MVESDKKYIKVSFVAPAVVLDFLSFLYRIAFINEWKENPGLMDGFYRTSMFSIAAPVESWKQLFVCISTLDPSYFHDRIGLLVFAVFLQTREFDSSFIEIDNMPDFVNDNDPVLIKKGMFELEMGKITNVEEQALKFDIE